MINKHRRIFLLSILAFFPLTLITLSLLFASPEKTRRPMTSTMLSI